MYHADFNDYYWIQQRENRLGKVTFNVPFLSNLKCGSVQCPSLSLTGVNLTCAQPCPSIMITSFIRHTLSIWKFPISSLVANCLYGLDSKEIRAPRMVAFTSLMTWLCRVTLGHMHTLQSSWRWAPGGHTLVHSRNIIAKTKRYYIEL